MSAPVDPVQEVEAILRDGELSGPQLEREEQGGRRPPKILEAARSSWSDPRPAESWSMFARARRAHYAELDDESGADNAPSIEGGGDGEDGEDGADNGRSIEDGADGENRPDQRTTRAQARRGRRGGAAGMTEQSPARARADCLPDGPSKTGPGTTSLSSGPSSPVQDNAPSFGLDRARRRQGFREVVIPEGPAAECDACGATIRPGGRVWVRPPWGRQRAEVRCLECGRRRGVGKLRGSSGATAKADDVQRIVTFLLDKPDATAQEIATAIGRKIHATRARLRLLVERGEIERSPGGRLGQRGGKSVRYRIAEPIVTIPAHWRVATDDLVATMREHVSGKAAVTLLEELETAGLIAAVDATGYAVTPWTQEQYGSALGEFMDGGPA